MTKRFITIALVLLWASLAQATQYYVDNSCSPACSGASCGQSSTCHATTGPFATLAAMVAKSGGYTADDIISIKRGTTYYETFAFPSSGSAPSSVPGDNNIIINNYGDASADLPIVSGEFANPSTYSWTTESAHVFYLGSVNNDPSYLWRTTSTGYTYKMQENTTSVASLMDLEWFYDSGNKRVYVKDLSGSSAPTDTIRIPYRAGITASNKQFITVDGIKFLYASTGIQASTSAEGWIVQNCVIGNTYSYAISMTGGAKNAIIQRNVIHDFVGSASSTIGVAAGASAGDYVKIDYNLFNNTFTPSFSSGTQPGALYIRNNTFRTVPSYYFSATSTSAFAVYDVRNNIFGSSGWYSASTVQNVSAGPTHTFDYNTYVSTGTTALDTDVTDGAHSKKGSAQFTYPMRYGILCITEDNVTGGPVEELAPIAYARGVPVTMALSGIEWNNLGAGGQTTYTPMIQNLPSMGHELGNHTKNHCTWTLMNGLAIRYTGAGAAASLNIGSNLFTVTVDGGTDIQYDLTNASYDTMTEVVAALNATGRYTAAVKTASTSSTANLKSTILKDATYADIKTGSVDVAMDETRYVADEATDWNSTLTSLFGITPALLTYPDTSPTQSATVVSALVASGTFEAARSATAAGFLLSSGVDLFYTDCAAGMFVLTTWYSFESAMTDSWNSQTLTGANTGYNNTHKVYGSYSLEFTKASSSYAYRATSTHWDKSGKDWLITMFVKPKDLDAKQTIFSHATDADNFCELYLDTSGYVHFDVKTGGSYVMQLTSSSAITTSYFYRITLYQAGDIWRMWIGQVTNATTFVAPTKVIDARYDITLPAYTGDVQFGRFYNGSSGSDYLNGYIDALATEKGGYFKSMAQLSMLADSGAFRTFLSHAESGLSRGIYIRVFDTIEDFNGAPNSQTSGKVRLMTHHGAVTHLKNNGRTATDVRGGANVYRYDIPYLLPMSLWGDVRITSKAVYGGADLSITGGDMYGIPLRDSTKPTIGCCEKYPKIF